MPAATLHYWIEPCAQAASGCKTDDVELAEWAMDAWQAASSGKLHLVKTGVQADAQIRLHWASGANGLYGETQAIQVHGLRGGEVYVLPTVVSGGEQDPLLRDAIVYLTCLHETGHALGLSHSRNFADIMYSFAFGGDITEYFHRYDRLLHKRADIRKNPGLSDQDRARLHELFP